MILFTLLPEAIMAIFNSRMYSSLNYYSQSQRGKLMCFVSKYSIYYFLLRFYFLDQFLRAQQNLEEDTEIFHNSSLHTHSFFQYFFKPYEGRNKLYLICNLWHNYIARVHTTSIITAGYTWFPQTHGIFPILKN